MKGCFTCLTRTVVAVLLLAIIGLLAAWLFLLPQLDRTLEDSIRREFILPPSSTVVVSRGSMLDTLEGEVDSVLVESDEAKLDGLVVSDFKLMAEGIRIDLVRTALSQQAEFTEMTYGETSFSVTDKALKNRWAADLQRRGFSDIEISLGDEVSITAKFDLRITKIDVLVTGWIEAADDDRVRFTADRIEIAGADVALEQIKASVSSLAPIIDLGRLKLDLKLNQLETADGRLYISANSRGMEGRLAQERKMKAELELEQAAEEAGDEDLVEQIRGLLDLNGEERSKEMAEVMDQLRERGIQTSEQLNQFLDRQVDSLQDEYQSVLRELNRMIEMQLDNAEENRAQDGSGSEAGDSDD